MAKFNVNWCQWWNEEIQEPDGVMRCLGEANSRGEVGELINDALFCASLEGWGEGFIAVTDEEGELLELIPGEPAEVPI